MCGRNLVRSKTYLDTDQGANGNLRKNLLPSPALTFFSLCVPLFLYSYSACIVDKVYGVGWWAANPASSFYVSWGWAGRMDGIKARANA